MVCASCGSENKPGAKFCSACGAALTLRCQGCGAAVEPGARFCSECGLAVTGASAASAVLAPATPPETELRFVSVLFVDLVGFTALSESRDPEDVRELLSRYFVIARTIIERYGGTIEKFIGDAVMAVWGAVAAGEDDGERAVRAGLEIVDAVSAFGAEVGAPGLRARAGVVTGQAATVDNVGEGIVTGDRVNTAARVQSAAAPGSVFVDEVTRRVASGAILFEDAGEHAAKGKAEPLHLWRAVRVVAGAGGRGRDSGFEFPFVGRDPDLRLLKELFHGSVERRAARLVAVSGEAGVGKSRLLQELSNYTDGLADSFLWHSGRCLAHGDGVAYWALSEMVRQRFGIPEDAAEQEISAKLEAGLTRWLPDQADREFVRPRLGALLGVADPGLGQSELFAGWRLFFERLAATEPVTMVFEDMQWADAGLLEFIEQLVDWSASLPMFVVVVARPELAAERDGWPAGRRGATTINLDPLEEGELRELVVELVENIPLEAVDRIVERAQGMPLYAIEIVRSLLDRGVVTERDGRLQLAGEIGEELEVPATLNALLSARLDGLDADERTLVKAMAVFGGSFPREAAAALTELAESQLDAALDGLVRKQVLVVRADPLSPNRGQYAFAQSLLRTVAYELLSRRERKQRHLMAAAHLRRAFANEGEDVAEVIAAHQLAAQRAAGEDADADELRSAAVAALRRAAERAATVGAPDSAERSYRTAMELADGDGERLELTQLAAQMAAQAGRHDAAMELFGVVVAAYTAAGRERDAARLEVQIGHLLTRQRRIDEAIERLGAALRTLDADPLDPDVAALESELGRALAFAGRSEEARPHLEAALQSAAALDLPAVLCIALSTTAAANVDAGRPYEARFQFAAAIELASTHGLITERGSALTNDGDLRMKWDLPGAREVLEESLANARRLGNRYAAGITVSNLMYVLTNEGEWQRTQQLGDEVLSADPDPVVTAFMCASMVTVALLRGANDQVREYLGPLEAWQHSESADMALGHASVSTRLDLAEGRTEAGLARSRTLLAEAMSTFGPSVEAFRDVWPEAVSTAIAAGRLDTANELIALLADLPPGHIPPFLRHHLARARGLLAAASGEHEQVEADLQAAVSGFEALRYPYWQAVAQTDLAAWLIDQGRTQEAAALLQDAATALQRLGAAPALARAQGLLDAAPVTA